MKFRWLLPVAALTLLSCTDEGEKHLAKAKERYEVLVRAGTPASDPAFDPVLSELAKVKPSSRASSSARKLERAIQGARSTRLEPPLAVASPAENDEYAATKKKCAELAQKLGPAAGAEREAATRALEDCQKELLEREKAHFKEQH